MAPNMFFRVALMAALVFTALAHFNLRQPAPYNPIQCSPFTNPRCAPPCPPIAHYGYSAAQSSPTTPTAQWRRGETVAVEWHRSNHDGGFYRRSLVPVAHMFNKTWHMRTAFEWGWWSQGFFYCGNAVGCGTGFGGLAHASNITVLAIFPDGDYVFSMAWDGGIHFRRERAFFPDYCTCAFVRIEGGPLADSMTPTFNPGYNRLRDLPPGTCASASRFISECGGQTCCKNPVFRAPPGAFDNGSTPGKRYLVTVEGAIEDNNGTIFPFISQYLGN